VDAAAVQDRQAVAVRQWLSTGIRLLQRGPPADDCGVALGSR
jgi:hypothetical protein